jgi:hypothetical protein
LIRKTTISSDGRSTMRDSDTAMEIDPERFVLTLPCGLFGI